MKLLKRLSISLAAIIIVYIALCFIGPKSYEGQSTLEIDAPASMIFEKVIDLSSWSQWSPGLMADTTLQLEFGEKKSGIGSSFDWKGSDNRKGKVEVIDAETNTYIKTKMSFSGWDGSNYGIWNFTPTEKNKTQVEWSVDSDKNIGFFMRGMMFLNGSNKALTQSFKKGLKKLKSLLENERKALKKVKVKEKEFPQRTFLIKRAEVPMENIPSYYAENFGILAKAIMTQKTEMDGMPCGLFYNWNTASQSTDMAAAIPVKEIFDMKDVNFSTIPGGKALFVDHYGEYHTVTVAHKAIQAYAMKNGLDISMPCVEEYMNDPSLVNDPAEIHTRIIYYLK